jgi:hypothetical protein
MPWPLLFLYGSAASQAFVKTPKDGGDTINDVLQSTS